MSIPHNLKQIRACLGLSQEAFADRMAVTKGMINQYEQGKSTPQIDFVLKLTYLTGLNVEDLLYRNLHADAFPPDMSLDNLQKPAQAYRKKVNLYDVREMVQEIERLRQEIEELKKAHKDKNQ